MYFNSKTLLSSAVLAIAAVATPLAADTIIVDFADIETNSGSFDFVDVNNDGAADVFQQVSRFDGVASVGGAEGGVGVAGGTTAGDYYSYGSVLIDSDGDLVSLANGASVDANIATTLGASWTASTGTAYTMGDLTSGIIPDEGDSAFIGVKMDRFTYVDDEGCNGCEAGIQATYLGTFYAWLNIEHGSMISLFSGYGSAAGVAAVVPTTMAPVPLPAGLPLLLAGLGAFGFVRSRKSA